MRKHPRSTMAMTVDDFRIVAKSKDPAKVSKIVGEKFLDRTVVIFGNFNEKKNYLFAGA